VVAQRGQCLDKRVVPVPAGRDDSGLEAEPVDQMLDPVAEIRPGLAGLFRQQGGPVGRTLQLVELGRERVMTGCHASRFVVHAGTREAESPARRSRRSAAMMLSVAVALPVVRQDG